MLCFLMLSIAFHGVTKNILDFLYFFFYMIFLFNPVQSDNPKLMSCGQLSEDY